jgi:hypothetical protein
LAQVLIQIEDTGEVRRELRYDDSSEAAAFLAFYDRLQFALDELTQQAHRAAHGETLGANEERRLAQHLMALKADR